MADTPMMRQYKSIKEKHQDSVVFFRMGDFYEMFYSDAEEVSRLLNLTLTKRQGVPMCGIPYHAAQNYLARLMQAGKRVAICEQVEVAPVAGKSLARREVVEIVSPGTVMQEQLLNRRENNYLQAFCQIDQVLGMALLDFSTGEFFAASFLVPSPELRAEILQRELLLAASRELLVMEELYDDLGEFWNHDGRQSLLCNRMPSWYFAPANAERKLTEFFGVQSLKGFGFEASGEALAPKQGSTLGAGLGAELGAGLGAAWVLVEYLQQNYPQSGVLAHVQRLRPLRRKDQLQLDSAALRNLEVFQNMQSRGRDYTLFEILHDCQSAMGSRCLHRWMSQPLIDKSALEQRYDRIELLLGDGMLRSALRQNLAELSDLERVMSRIVTAKANPRDLVTLRSSLLVYEELYSRLGAHKNKAVLYALFEPLHSEASGSTVHPGLKELRELLQRSVADSPPAVLHEGGMIAAEYSAELDELRLMSQDRRKILDEYVAREQKNIGEAKLKLKYNRIIGYYFELSKAQVAQLRLPPHFIRRQSLVNGERYSTEELANLEAKLSSADERVVQLERKLFEELRRQILPYAPSVLSLAQILAELDVLSNFAELALRYNYVRPELLSSAGELYVEGGRHPVVEHYMRDESFVPNGLHLDRQNFFALITGPNMAGKSTYLRQNALIVLMAQAGCFVPAKRVQMSLVDQIFCRVGASDNLSRGESTFMVEMQETARILHEASASSLVIMDEVGRGTSTRDGLAIAQSICEYILSEIQCLTLFATHYHELTNLEAEHLKLLCLAVDESEAGKIRFLKHVAEGAIASSYGVHVAALAGIPQTVTARAAEILEQLPGQAKKETLRPEKDKFFHTQAQGLYELRRNSLNEFSELAVAEDEIQIKYSKAVADADVRDVKRSQKAQKQNLLFSEADLLLDDLEQLAANGLQDLDGAAALGILRAWAQKYL